MSDADKAYKAAQRLIADTLVNDRNVLDLDTGQTHALTTLPPEISDLAGIILLSLSNTQITDLAPLAEMTGIITLLLDNTQITDLTPLARMTGLATLWLDETQVTDLRPLLALPQLSEDPEYGGLGFRITPATKLDPKLDELSKIEDDKTRAAKTFAYLREVGDNWPPNQNGTPTDRLSAPIYTFPASGPIKSADEAPAGGDEDQDALREDLQKKAANLINAIGGSNELGQLREQVEHYQGRLAATPIRIKLLWAAANALRQAYEKDERAEVTARNTDLLPPKVSAALGDVVETHALFIMGFENAAALEQQMRDGLTGKRSPEQLATGTAIVTALDNRPDAIDADDYAALSDDAAAAQGVGDSAEMAENDLDNRLWNLLGAAGRKARVWVAMGTKGGGAALLGHDFIQFLLGNETLIMTYLRLAQGRAAEWFPKLLEAIRVVLGA